MPKYVFLFIAFCLSTTAFAKGNAGPAGDGKPEDYELIYNETVLGKSKEQYFQAVNGGWSTNLSDFRRNLDQTKSYLVIHALEPKKVYDLRSPEQFKFSMLSNCILNLSNDSVGIGHVFLSWRCEVNQKMVEGTVGMTGELDNQFKKLMDNGHGLAAFLAVFEDGHLQTSRLLDFEFDGGDPVHTLAVEVDPSICQNAMGFVKQFLMHQNEPYYNFGLHPNPEKFEGGGCGSLGATVLHKSGLLNGYSIVPSFWRSLRANPDLFGYGLEPMEDVIPYELYKTGRKEVDKITLFASHWNSSHGPQLRLMDPEMMLLFFKTVYRFALDDVYAKNRNLGRSLLHSRLYKYRILKSDGSHYPDGSQTLSSEIRIDTFFDPKAKQVASQTSAWVRNLRSSGYGFKPAIFGKKARNFGLVFGRD